MNAAFDGRQNDDRRIDRLVDGELSEAERHELLSTLDRQPDGWRRCALAFLEAQEFGASLGELVRPAPKPVAAQPMVPAAPLPVVPARRRWSQGHTGTLLAAAASFLLALGLSTAVQQWWHGTGRNPTPPRDLFAENQSPGTTVQPSGAAPGTAALPAATPWQRVRLALPDGPDGPGQTIELPACERDRIDDDWIRSLPAALSPDALKALQKAGFEVRQKRQILPLPMEDGRRLVVPVDQLELHYVGHRAY